MNRTVLVLVDDPFWKSKIDHALQASAAPAVFLSDPAELQAAVDPARAGVVLVDLALKKEPFSAIRRLKQETLTAGIPVVGYFEKVRKDLDEKARAAAFDQILNRGAFSEKLPDLILQYSLPGSVRVAEDENELPEE